MPTKPDLTESKKRGRKATVISAELLIETEDINYNLGSAIKLIVQSTKGKLAEPNIKQLEEAITHLERELMSRRKKLRASKTEEAGVVALVPDSAIRGSDLMGGPMTGVSTSTEA